jgi:hypothetical protein
MNSDYKSNLMMRQSNKEKNINMFHGHDSKQCHLRME